MPELPEVETARQLLERWARGRRVRRVIVSDKRAVGGGPRSLAALVNARFDRFERRGKHLLITLRHGHQVVGLWSHLGMSGKWLRRQPGQPPSRFSRVALELDDGVILHFDDLRLFGKLRVVKDAAFDAQPVIAALGPDPLNDGVDVPRLAARLGRSKKPVKPLLLDQTLVPGIGNIQASEALFRAAIDPRRPAASLTRAEVGRLARGMRQSIDYTLRSFKKDVRGKDIQYVEDPAGPNPFKVYDRAGEKCPRCKPGKITRIVQAGRSTFFCDRCQK
jgi:formamidopyrimidine-DNA glycosylase